MDFLFSTELTIPLSQIAALLLLSTFALLAGKVKLALLINYAFTLYWGYIVNINMFFDKSKDMTVYTYVYLGLGILILFIAAATFFSKNE